MNPRICEIEEVYVGTQYQVVAVGPTQKQPETWSYFWALAWNSHAEEWALIKRVNSGRPGEQWRNVEVLRCTNATFANSYRMWIRKLDESSRFFESLECPVDGGEKEMIPWIND